MKFLRAITAAFVSLGLACAAVGSVHSLNADWRFAKAPKTIPLAQAKASVETNGVKVEDPAFDDSAWETEKEECRAGRGASPFRSKADPRLDIPDKVGIGLGKGSERTAKRILELLVDGPMRPSALREAVGIKSPIHFSRYYLRPLMEKGMIERTDPDSPKSPRQEYKLA